MIDFKRTSSTSGLEDDYRAKQDVGRRERQKQLDTLKLLDDYYTIRGSWYAVIAGWAREAHLGKPQPHKDIDVLVPANLARPDTKVGVDFIRMEGSPQVGLWISVISPKLLKFYIPSIAAKPVEVKVEGVNFKALRPEALLLTMVGEGKIPIPSWTPHFGNKQPKEKFASGWRDLKEIENPKVTHQMVDAGFGFYLAGHRIEWLRKALESLIRK